MFLNVYLIKQKLNKNKTEPLDPSWQGRLSSLCSDRMYFQYCHRIFRLRRLAFPQVWLLIWPATRRSEVPHPFLPGASRVRKIMFSYLLSLAWHHLVAERRHLYEFGHHLKYQWYVVKACCHNKIVRNVYPTVLSGTSWRQKVTKLYTASLRYTTLWRQI